MQLVSIHAPGRGATCIRSIGMSSVMSFNSRTREGCDVFGVRLPDEYITFQFTHPGGVRQSSIPTKL